MVECQLPKLNVASSSLVTRSKKNKIPFRVRSSGTSCPCGNTRKGIFCFFSDVPPIAPLVHPNPFPPADTFQPQSRPANLYNLPLTRPAGRHCLQKNRQDTYKVCLITRPNRQTSTKPETYRQKSAEKPTKNRQENIPMKLI